MATIGSLTVNLSLDSASFVSDLNSASSAVASSGARSRSAYRVHKSGRRDGQDGFGQRKPTLIALKLLGPVLCQGRRAARQGRRRGSRRNAASAERGNAGDA